MARRDRGKAAGYTYQDIARFYQMTCDTFPDKKFLPHLNDKSLSDLLNKSGPMRLVLAHAMIEGNYSPI